MLFYFFLVGVFLRTNETVWRFIHVQPTINFQKRAQTKNILSIVFYALLSLINSFSMLYCVRTVIVLRIWTENKISQSKIRAPSNFLWNPHNKLTLSLLITYSRCLTQCLLFSLCDRSEHLLKRDLIFT